MTLSEIAIAMKRETRQTGLARCPLPRGLFLTLRYDDGDWILSLTRRRGVHASEKERNICRDRFGVPDDAELELEFVDGYGVTRLRWSEPGPELRGATEGEQVALFALACPEKDLPK